MKALLAALAFACVAHAEPSAVSRELRVTGEIEHPLVLFPDALRSLKFVQAGGSRCARRHRARWKTVGGR
jgi:hypothetical protein